jgi:hypothetical protein
MFTSSSPPLPVLPQHLTRPLLDNAHALSKPTETCVVTGDAHLLARQLPLTQSVPCPHALSRAQRPHVPPQSTSLSSPLRTPSAQVAGLLLPASVTTPPLAPLPPLLLLLMPLGPPLLLLFSGGPSIDVASEEQLRSTADAETSRARMEFMRKSVAQRNGARKAKAFEITHF